MSESIQSHRAWLMCYGGSAWGKTGREFVRNDYDAPRKRRSNSCRVLMLNLYRRMDCTMCFGYVSCEYFVLCNCRRRSIHHVHIAKAWRMYARKNERKRERMKGPFMMLPNRFVKFHLASFCATQYTTAIAIKPRHNIDYHITPAHGIRRPPFCLLVLIR